MSTTTDWDLIRSMMDTAIAFCQQVEALGCTEADRDRIAVSDSSTSTVYDHMVSAWTIPEALRYDIIRDRHAQGADLPYVPEFSRILVAMAQAAAELVGGKDAAPAQAALDRMLPWYRDYAVPNIAKAMGAAGATRATGDASPGDRA